MLLVILVTGRTTRPFIEDFHQFIEFRRGSLQIRDLFCRFK